MLLAQQVRQLDQRHVHLALDRRQNDIAIGFNTMGPPVATLPLGTQGARLAPFPDPADRAGGRYTKPSRCRPSRQPAINRRYYASAQIFR